MYRLGRLCSQNEDYEAALRGLKERCVNTGYNMDMVGNIMKNAGDIPREIKKRRAKEISDVCKIRWVTMAHSNAENEIEQFVKNINSALRNQHIMFELIKTTAPTLGKLLFNNNNSKDLMELSKTCRSRCQVCVNGSRKDETKVTGSANGESYSIDGKTTCRNSGIYMVTCKCNEQYIGKTTVQFNRRFNEHLTKATSVKEHLDACDTTPSAEDVNIQYLENVWNRGKYALSEREFLWNKRLKGSINVQKTIKNCT